MASPPSRLLMRLLMVMIGVSAVSATLAEQPLGGERKNQMGLFIWTPSLSGTMTVNDQSIPIEASFEQLFENVSLGGSLNYERAAEPWGFLFSVLFMESESTFTTPESGRPGTHVGNFLMSDAVATRQWSLASNKVGMALLFGLRHWSLDQSFAIESDPEIEGGGDWLDGVLGCRVTVQMADNWWFIGRLDGAAGGSDFTLNTSAMFDWRATDLFSLAFGYRWMNLQYETGSGDSTFGMDTDMGGLMVAFEFSF